MASSRTSPSRKEFQSVVFICSFPSCEHLQSKKIFPHLLQNGMLTGIIIPSLCKSLLICPPPAGSSTKGLLSYTFQPATQAEQHLVAGRVHSKPQSMSRFLTHQSPNHSLL